MSDTQLPSPSLKNKIENYFDEVAHKVYNSRINPNENKEYIPIIVGQEVHRELLTSEMAEKFYNASSAKKQDTTLCGKNLENLHSLDHLFSNYVKARNGLSKSRRYNNFPELLFQDIKLNKYGVDQVIEMLKKYLIQTANNTSSLHSFWEIMQSAHKICHLTNVPKPNVKVAFSLLESEYPLLPQATSQIKYENNNKSITLYNPHTNIFTVKLKRDECSNHKFISLLHELSHVGYLLLNFNQEKNPWLAGKYKEEFSVAITLAKILPKISPKLWFLYQTEKRLFITSLLFQLITYTIEPKSPSSLYLKILKISYPYTKIKSNYRYSYLYHKNIMSEPLNGLAQVLSFINSLD